MSEQANHAHRDEMYVNFNEIGFINKSITNIKLYYFGKQKYRTLPQV